MAKTMIFYYNSLQDVFYSTVCTQFAYDSIAKFSEPKTGLKIAKRFRTEVFLLLRAYNVKKNFINDSH